MRAASPVCDSSPKTSEAFARAKGFRNSNAAPTFARYASEHRGHCPAPRDDDYIGGRKQASREKCGRILDAAPPHLTGRCTRGEKAAM